MALAAMTLACGDAAPPSDTPSPAVTESTPSPRAERLRFTDASNDVGLSFVHDNGARGDYNYPELMQGGVALFDFDRDDDLDIYFLQSGELPASGDARAANVLYRNDGATWTDVTRDAGLGDTGYGSAAAIADVDADGFEDVFVTNLGPNALYRNRGDGTFENVTARAGVAGAVSDYSTSAAFVDIDHDGDVDLFVCNYVAWSPAVEHRCVGPHGARGYCNPAEYAPQSDRLYENRGDGRFVEITRASGVGSERANGLGVAAADFTGDGLVDLYVANDQMPNHLWVNRGEGRFVDEGVLRGVAFNGAGLSEAGMGIAREDFDDDGDPDLFVTHLSHETNTLYRNGGEGYFHDVTDALALGAVSQPYTGFGTGFRDFDLDGRLDLFIANGKVSAVDAADLTYAEPNQLLVGPTFFPSNSLNELTTRTSRAAAFGDIDEDGDIDIVVANNGGPARLLRNDSEPSGSWLIVDVVGSAGAPTIGAVVVLESERQAEDGERIVHRRTRRTGGASSYAARSAPSAHFGLAPEEQPTKLDVLWPDGTSQTQPVASADLRLRVGPEGLEPLTAQGGA